MAAYDETVRFRAIKPFRLSPENRWPSKDTRCISSVTSCCGAETPPPQRPYPSHQHCGCYVESIPIEFPTLYRYVSIMMAQNRGPFNWMGRLVPRLGSHKVFYCSSTYVQLVDSNVFFSELCLVDGFNYVALFSRRNGMFVWLSTFLGGISWNYQDIIYHHIIVYMSSHPKDFRKLNYQYFQ